METTHPKVRGQICNHVLDTYEDHLIPWNEKVRLILGMMQQGLDSVRLDSFNLCANPTLRGMHMIRPPDYRIEGVHTLTLVG